MTEISPQKAALVRRREELQAFITAKCETSLHTFVAEAWPVVEVQRPFIDNWHIGAICLPGESIIATREGPMRISDLVESRWHGDVLSINHVTSRAEWRAVTAWMRSPARSLRKIETSNGRLLATGNHPVFVVGRGYISADRVSVGDVVQTVRRDARSIVSFAAPSVLWPRVFRRVQAHAATTVRRLRQVLRTALAVTPLSWLLRTIAEARLGTSVPGVRFACLQNADGACVRSEDLLRLQVRRRLSPAAGQSRAVSVRVQDDQADDSRTRRTLLPSLWSGECARRRKAETDAARSASRRLEQAAQRAGESCDALQDLPRETRLERDARGHSYEVSKSTVVAVSDALRLPDAVYNIEVDGNHNYFADSVLVHNCEHLEAVVAGQIKQLGINVPPSTGKSTIVSVCFPAWVWAHQPPNGFARGGDLRQAVRAARQQVAAPIAAPIPDAWRPRVGPTQRFMCASYDQTQATRDNMRMRDLVLSDWYQRRWPIQLLENLKTKYTTADAGWRMMLSVAAPRMGEHPNYKIIDDPHNPKKQLLSDAEIQAALQWYGLFKVRGAMLDAATVLIMQRLHERDLCGYLRDTEPDWTWLILPMRWEPKRMVEIVTGWRDPREPQAGALLWPSQWPDAKVTGTYPPGSWADAGQFQQRPAPAGGLMFKRSDFVIVNAMPTDVVSTVRSWDVAGTAEASKSKTSARTVGLRMSQTASGKYVITDIQKGWWESDEVDRMMLQTARLDGPDVRIREEREGGSSGKAVIAYHRRQLAGYPYDEYGVAGKGSKVQRAIPLQAQSKGGNVWIFVPLMADGSPDPTAQKMATEFLDEIELFPAGTLKDQVDAASQAFNILTIGGGVPLDIYSGEEAIAREHAPEKAAAYLGEKGYTIPDVDPDDVDGIEDLLP